MKRSNLKVTENMRVYRNMPVVNTPLILFDENLQPLVMQTDEINEAIELWFNENLEPEKDCRVSKANIAKLFLAYWQTFIVDHEALKKVTEKELHATLRRYITNKFVWGHNKSNRMWLVDVRFIPAQKSA